MTRTLFAILVGCALGGCAVLDPSADTASAAQHAERDYVTGSRLPSRNHNASGTKVYEMNPLDRDEMLRPKSTTILQ